MIKTVIDNLDFEVADLWCGDGIVPFYEYIGYRVCKGNSYLQLNKWEVIPRKDCISDAEQ